MLVCGGSSASAVHSWLAARDPLSLNPHCWPSRLLHLCKNVDVEISMPAGRLAQQVLIHGSTSLFPTLQIHCKDRAGMAQKSGAFSEWEIGGGGAREVSVAKRACCSCRGATLGSQHPYQVGHNHLFQGNLRPSFDVYG